MTTKQILFSAFLLGTINTIGFAMQQNQKVKRFDKGGETKLNNNSRCCVDASIYLYDTCTEDNNIKIIEIINNTKVQQGTIGSFKNKYHNTKKKFLSDRNEYAPKSIRRKKRSYIDRTVIKFLTNIHNNNALFDPNNQTIFHGSEMDINNFDNDRINYNNKIKLLDEKLKPKKARLRFNKKFVELYCKENQCTILKAEMEKTEKEINQLYQNL